MDHEDFKGLSYKTGLKKKINDPTKSNFSSDNSYRHNLRLKSAYDLEIMPYTNYTYEFKGIIDYIYLSSDTMNPVAALGSIEADWFKDNKVVGCPHPHVPSGVLSSPIIFLKISLILELLSLPRDVSCVEYANRSYDLSFL